MRANDGRFLRIRKVWDGSDWDDGYLDVKGKFRVYRPDCPRSYSGGYAFRAHVVWWLKNGAHPRGTVLHHVNEVKTDDRLENLQVLETGEHTRMHCRKIIWLICEQCGCGFTKDNDHPERQSRFCSQKCYHLHPRKESHKNAISKGLKVAHLEGRR